MDMSGVTRNLQLLLRSERVLAEMQLKLMTRKAVLGAGAAIATLLALAMFNVAGYFALAQPLGSPSAALIVGLIDALIAGLLLVVAQALRTGSEEDMVREVRDMALSELGVEIDDLQQKLMQMGENVETVRTNVANFVQRPLDSLLPQLIVPAVSAVTKLAKARKKEPSQKGKD